MLAAFQDRGDQVGGNGFRSELNKDARAGCVHGLDPGDKLDGAQNVVLEVALLFCARLRIRFGRGV